MSTTYRLVTDERGSVRLVVNVSTGAIVSSLSYDVWGNVTSSVSPSFQPFGFAGGLRDDATNLTHFGAREYAPELGRWTRKDPIGFNGGLADLYGYVGNDPVNWVDVGGYRPDETEFSRMDPEYDNSMAFPSIPGSVTYNAHGDANGFYDAGGNPVSLLSVSEKIRNNPKYAGSSSVVLYACNTGNSKNGTPIAQKLANLLGKPVSAPNGYLFDDLTGHYWVNMSQNRNMAPGRFITFYPSNFSGF